ncbi:hypothetical protein [Alphaproteobacteria bacterium endosymbiont of Tiliacea citrago]|uniref:hypothetical protein n=1 Tax=Alphaproteobacteria bacterium endosymbiont of Tiliacea citrago TaxID=3077944 RepID=UPI00313D6B3D
MSKKFRNIVRLFFLQSKIWGMNNCLISGLNEMDLAAYSTPVLTMGSQLQTLSNEEATNLDEKIDISIDDETKEFMAFLEKTDLKNLTFSDFLTILDKYYYSNDILTRLISSLFETDRVFPNLSCDEIISVFHRLQKMQNVFFIVN